MLLCIDMKILCLYFLISIDSVAFMQYANVDATRPIAQNTDTHTHTYRAIQSNKNCHQIYLFVFFSFYLYLVRSVRFFLSILLVWLFLVTFPIGLKRAIQLLWFVFLSPLVFIYPYLYDVATWWFSLCVLSLFIRWCCAHSSCSSVCLWIEKTSWITLVHNIQVECGILCISLFFPLFFMFWLLFFPKVRSHSHLFFFVLKKYHQFFVMLS